MGAVFILLLPFFSLSALVSSLFALIFVLLRSLRSWAFFNRVLSVCLCIPGYHHCKHDCLAKNSRDYISAPQEWYSSGCWGVEIAFKMYKHHFCRSEIYKTHLWKNEIAVNDLVYWVPKSQSCCAWVGGLASIALPLEFQFGWLLHTVGTVWRQHCSDPYMWHLSGRFFYCYVF